MYILKNALVSITRNKGRNLLIGIIIVVIASSASITLAINNSASTLIKSYQNKYDLVATIGINRENMKNMLDFKDMTEDERKEQKEKMNESFENASNISIEDIDKYGDSKYVKSYYYQISVGVNSDIDIVSMDASDEEGITGRGFGKQENFKNMNQGDFTLTGYSTLTAMEDFISGKYKIIDGTLTDDLESNNCVINSELATANDIKVGDTITFTNPDDDEDKIELKVTGIFSEDSTTDDMMGMFTKSANNIITMSKVVTDFTSNSDIKYSITPAFTLTSKDVIDDFTKEIQDKGLDENLSVTTNLDEVNSATSTISNVKTFAVTFLIITLIIGGVFLFVINMINIRERKYEIGVLRTIGMKKSHLTIQFISELLIVALISLIIGSGIGAISSVKISNYLLQSEINNSEEEKTNIENNFGHGREFKNFDKINGNVNIEKIDKIDAAVDLKVLSELLVIGVVLTLVSSIASMISIQKFSPLTILKERS